MLTGPDIILSLKVAVGLVTFLLALSLAALACRRPRLHGWLNILVVVLTLLAVGVLELLIRMLGISITAGWDESARLALRIHLFFVIPLMPMLIIMLVTGLRRKIRQHLWFSILFIVLWTGMFVTGMFFLPHSH